MAMLEYKSQKDILIYHSTTKRINDLIYLLFVIFRIWSDSFVDVGKAGVIHTGDQRLHTSDEKNLSIPV